MPRNTRRADGLIAVQVYLGRDENNKRKYKTVYGKTQKEANEKALQVKLAMKKGLDLSAERDTFDVWAQRWLKLKSTEVSASQMVAYRSCVSHASEYIGSMRIGDVRAADVQEIILDIATENPKTHRPSSKQTLKVLKSAISQTFQLAIDNRVLDFNPADVVKIPSSAPKDTRRALTAEEQRWIVETPHRAQTAAMIMMYAGLRRGEVIALQWDDIDLSAQTIRVNKAAERIDGKFIVKPCTKTQAGMRTVYIPDVLTAYLCDAKKASTSVYVTTDASGKLHTDSSWNRMWESYLNELNRKYGTFAQTIGSRHAPTKIPFAIPKITPHWLRHTFATMLYFAGYDIKAAMDQLGHADAKTTMQIYTHLDAEHRKKSASALNAYLENKACK